MWLPHLLAFLGLVALGAHASNSDQPASNVTYYGAPRHILEGVLPIIDITEGYIRAQIDHGIGKASGFLGVNQCDVNNPCKDGSCCNSNGQCGFRYEHCRPASPDRCVSNCNAKAPCGEFSKDGQTSCTLNLCCSFFGTCGPSELFCRQETQSGADASCQGNCGEALTPSCGAESGTASRRIAYYESWNLRRRGCDKIMPSQINTSGLTHLVLAFAVINPKTFEIQTMHPNDEKIYEEFLALPESVSKWIGIGGWKFTDPGATHHTWSEMSSTEQNRGVFIKSLQKFLAKWKFQGIDIDWEWPGASSRGGNSDDGKNQVSLLAELRQTLGNDFGLSVVLPAQYEWLKEMDPKGLEAQVNWVSILTYDLHGTWDASIPGLGPSIKPHTDLAEIDSALKLLWSAEIAPSKVNLGTANYGRGFTVSDTNCMWYGCQYTGPSKAGICTNMDGVLSLCEIKRIVAEKNLTPHVISGGAGVKEITWDDQWIGYDDSQTFSLKAELANDRCLGGTALWAIDYDICDDGDSTPNPGSSVVSPPPASTPISSAASSVDQATSSAVPSLPPSVKPSGSSSSEPRSNIPVTSQQSSQANSGGFPVPTITSSTPNESSQPESSAASSPVATTEPASPTSIQSNSGAPQTSVVESSSGAFPSSGVESSSAASVTSEVESSSAVFATSGAESSSGASLIGTNTVPAASSESMTTSASQSPAPTGSSIPSSTSMEISTVSGAQPSSNSDSPTSSENPVMTTGSSTASSDASGSFSGSFSNAPVSSANPTESTVVSSGTTVVFPFPIPSDSGSSSTDASPSMTGTPSSWDSSTTLPSGTSTSGESLNIPSGTQSPSESSMNSIIWPTDASSSGSWSLSFPVGTQTSDSSWNFPSGTAPPSDSSTSSVFIPTGTVPTPPSSDSSNFPSGTQNSDSLNIPSGTQSSDSLSIPSGTQSSEAPSMSASSGASETGASSTPPPTGTQAPDQSSTPTPTQIPDDPDSDNVYDSDPECVENDCVAECIAWRLITLLAFKRPICPCIPKKCDGDHKKSNKKKKCKFLGCGCGWMGLPFGPGCEGKGFDFEFPEVDFPCGIFGCDGEGICAIWGCPPDEGKQIEGILGYGGFCKLTEGCEPCPPHICSGPKCTRAGGCGPKPGPPPTLPGSPGPGPTSTPPPTNPPGSPTPDIPPTNPATPSPTRQPGECDEKDKVKVTERFIFCTEGFAVSELPSSVGGGTTSSMISTACVPFISATLTVCPGLMAGYTSTTTKTATTTLSSEAPACTKAPLSLDDDEGDNMPNNGTFISTTIFASNTSSIATATSDSSTPNSTPTPAPMDKNGPWRVDLDQFVKKDKTCGLLWTLFDPNGNEAGKGSTSSDNNGFETYIESSNRPSEHMMPFGVTAKGTDCQNVDKVRVHFDIRKEMCSGAVSCAPSMTTEDKTEEHQFDVESCFDKCLGSSLRPSDFWCEDLNDGMWIFNVNEDWVRAFKCGWKGF